MALQLELVANNSITYKKGEQLTNVCAGSSTTFYNIILYSGKFWIAVTEESQITKLWQVKEYDTELQIYEALHAIAEGRYEF